MKKVNYKIIKEYFGIKFIQYIINYNDELNKQTTFEELELNTNQINTLIYLEDIIKECRQLCFTQVQTEDGFKIEKPFQGSHSQDREFEFKDCFQIIIKQIAPVIFNNLRKSCGGDFPQIKTGDSILEFLSNLMIQSYPCLLIKNNQTLSPFPHSVSTTITYHYNGKS